MNLTEVPPLAEFFSAEVANGTSRALFALGPESGKGTYYARRRETTMSPGDFELMEGCSRESIEEGLRTMWERRNPEMARLAPVVSRLAVELHQGREIEGELSPFIYVMF